MFMIVEGNLGEGKTLLLSHYGEKERKVPVYTNYDLDVPNFEKKITPYDIEGLKVGLVLLQGFYTWLDCRMSGTELNKYLTRDFVFNARKRKLTIIVDYQVEDSVDKRFTKLAKVKVEPYGLLPDESGFLYTYRYFSKGRCYKEKDRILPYSRAKYLFDLYNTDELEQTYTPSVFEPNRLNEFVNKFCSLIEKNYKGERITMNLINDVLLENCKTTVPSQKIIKLIHSRLTRRKDKKQRRKK